MIQIASPQIGKEEREAVDRVLRSGIIAQGPEVAEFEKEFAKLCGVKYAVAACNGTTAGHLVMLASGIGPGDEVITTPFTFFATASVVIMAGAKPVFVDIDLHTLSISPEKVIKKINKKTLAVFITHAQGFNGFTDNLLKELKKRNILLIEDVCESHGAKHKNKKLGTFGIISNFSSK